MDPIAGWISTFLRQTLVVTEVAFSIISLAALIGSIVIVAHLYRGGERAGEQRRRERESFSRHQVISEIRRRRQPPRPRRAIGDVGYSPVAKGQQVSFPPPITDPVFSDQLRVYYAALAVLGVSPSATRPEVKAAYRSLLRRYHPDNSGGDKDLMKSEKLQVVTEAYRELTKLLEDDDFIQRLRALSPPEV